MKNTKRLSKAELEKLSQKLAQKADFWKHLAHHDEVTGLYNKRYFNTILMRTVTRLLGSDRRKIKIQALVLMICDCNNFKKINDQFGHDMGDEVLKALGGILENSIRRDDLAARIGGDEFGIILAIPEKSQSKKAILAVKKRIFKNLNALNLMISNDHQIKPQISIGWTILEKGQKKTPQELFRQADKRMYQNKQGR